MSVGHPHKSKRTDTELDALLDNALSEPKIKARLARSFKLNVTNDIPLLGSSSIGGGAVYLDRNLKRENGAHGVLLIDSKQVDVHHPLVRHERLEQACEDELGYGYELAHEIATRWEHRWLTEHKISPAKYEVVLRPYIRASEKELLKVPTDMDLRPELAEPVDEALLARIRAAMARVKEPQALVNYVDKSATNKRCRGCSMFVQSAYGGPACTLVKGPINAQGYCKRFKAGELDA